MEPVSIALALAQAAPSIMRFFGVGEKPVAVAEKVVEIAQTVTGKQKPEEAMEAIQQDPALAIQFNLAVLAANNDLEKAYLADRQDARDREVKIATSDAAPMLNKVITPILALVVTLGGGAVLNFNNDPDVRMAAVSLMTLVLGYYFGTSQGSTKANQLFRDLARKQ